MATEEWWIAIDEVEEGELILGPFKSEAIAERALRWTLRPGLYVTKVTKVETLSMKDVFGRAMKKGTNE